ncbi:hypothetical protein BN871_JY_00050 [Paenibacillus sp. P22]|nr:hypothetical protein BN871_JY_00050 [Paenibacillus sp. P22]
MVHDAGFDGNRLLHRQAGSRGVLPGQPSADSGAGRQLHFPSGVVSGVGPARLQPSAACAGERLQAGPARGVSRYPVVSVRTGHGADDVLDLCQTLPVHRRDVLWRLHRRLAVPDRGQHGADDGARSGAVPARRASDAGGGGADPAVQLSGAARYSRDAAAVHRAVRQGYGTVFRFGHRFADSLGSSLSGRRPRHGPAHLHGKLPGADHVAAFVDGHDRLPEIQSLLPDRAAAAHARHGNRMGQKESAAASGARRRKGGSRRSGQGPGRPAVRAAAAKAEPGMRRPAEPRQAEADSRETGRQEPMGAPKRPEARTGSRTRVLALTAKTASGTRLAERLPTLTPSSRLQARKVRKPALRDAARPQISTRKVAIKGFSAIMALLTTE